MLSGIDMLIGVDLINMLGGMTYKNGKVFFGLTAADEGVREGQIERVPAALSLTHSPKLEIDDVDFSANFNGDVWIVRWKWMKAPDTHNKVACYHIPDDIRKPFEEEVELWISEDILVPVPVEEVDEAEHLPLIPLMAVQQQTKGKVRPVLDFRDLNKYVSSHTGEAVDCTSTLRKWRECVRQGVILDLRKAYLQLRVDKDLWKHQIIKYKNSYYYLTRLGFGLNCAPRIMTKVLSKVLSLDEKIMKATDHYIDDIIVNTEIVSIEQVRNHLKKYGLITKEPEPLDHARVLGLQLNNVDKVLVWKRGNKIEDFTENMTRRKLFSICGQLVGHYPVASWLRIACSYIKRCSQGTSWEDPIGEKAEKMLKQVLDRVSEGEDPVGGIWNVCFSNKLVRVYCDASSIATGCLLEVDGEVVEDCAWLRKKDDGAHINVAELEAVVRAFNLAIRWNLKRFEIVTDSASVFHWLNSILTGDKKIKTHGLAEMIVRRRLSVIRDLIDNYELDVTCVSVPSQNNRADILTRVKRSWLSTEEHKHDICAVTSPDDLLFVREVHERHHFGVERTWYLVKQSRRNISKKEVSEVVRSCTQCLSIDPAPITWEKGELSVNNNWWRLACDITHYDNKCYLTLIDCGPSKFAIWRKLSFEDSKSVHSVLSQIFRERGPPAELLCDNGAVFRSKMIENLCESWKTKLIFRCAYRPSGNGIIERHHRTVKATAAKSGSDPEQAVFWYNCLPKSGSNSESVPSNELYNYSWRIPVITEIQEDYNTNNSFKIGDQVTVKPPNSKCTSKWPTGIVTKINSTWSVDVNGFPRHIADIRLIKSADVTPAGTSRDDSESVLLSSNSLPVSSSQVSRSVESTNELTDTVAKKEETDRNEERFQAEEESNEVNGPNSNIEELMDSGVIDDEGDLVRNEYMIQVPSVERQCRPKRERREPIWMKDYEK